MVGPWIHFLQVLEDDVGDLEYIQGFVVSGNYFQVSGDINNLNDTIDFTVPNGKTALMIEAKIVITGHTDPAVIIGGNPPITVNVRNIVQAELKIDGVTKDTTNMGMNTKGTYFSSTNRDPSTNTYGNIGNGKFNVLGLSLVGNGAKKIEIENTLDNGTAFATMSGYLIDT